MKKTLNVTLAIVVETELESVDNVVDNLTFDISEDSENVEVLNQEVVDYFEVYM